ncbi:MAG: hypothetical protein HRU19_07010 [Pseudobacteriovorax sp.]|nr:hypothetical protein [Pseudobacteriovorax sp.]
MSNIIDKMNWEQRTIDANSRFSRGQFSEARRIYESLLAELDQNKDHVGKVCDICKVKYVDRYWVTCQNLADVNKSEKRPGPMTHYYFKPLQFVGEVMNRYDVYVSTYQELQKRYDRCLHYYLQYQKDCDPEFNSRVTFDVIENTKPAKFLRQDCHAVWDHPY